THLGRRARATIDADPFNGAVVHIGHRSAILPQPSAKRSIAFGDTTANPWSATTSTGLSRQTPSTVVHRSRPTTTVRLRGRPAELPESSAESGIRLCSLGTHAVAQMPIGCACALTLSRVTDLVVATLRFVDTAHFALS